MRWHVSQILWVGLGKEISVCSHHMNFSIESRLMFVFLWNVEDRNQSYVGIGIHSYEPKDYKGKKNPIRILSYRIPMKFIQTKGGLSFSEVSSYSKQIDQWLLANGWDSWKKMCAKRRKSSITSIRETKAIAYTLLYLQFFVLHCRS